MRQCVRFRILCVYEYEYKIMWMTSMCMSMMRQYWWVLCVWVCMSMMRQYCWVLCVWVCDNVWMYIWHMNSHIVCVVRHCGCQYYVCDNDFFTYDNNMFYYFGKHEGKQNWQHYFVLYRLTSVGHGHYRRKLLGLTFMDTYHSQWKLWDNFREPNPSRRKLRDNFSEPRPSRRK
jgi:hypothetical protein